METSSNSTACRDVESEQVRIKLERARSRVGRSLANIPTGRTYDSPPDQPVCDAFLVQPPADPDNVRKDDALRQESETSRSGNTESHEERKGEVELTKISQLGTLKSMCITTIEQFSTNSVSDDNDKKDVSLTSEASPPLPVAISVVMNSSPLQSPMTTTARSLGEAGVTEPPDHNNKSHHVTLKPELAREDRVQRADHRSLNEFLVSELEVYCSQLLGKGYSQRGSSGACDLARVTGLQLFQDHQRALMDFDDDWKRSHADKRPALGTLTEVQEVASNLNCNPFQLGNSNPISVNEWQTLLTQVKASNTKSTPAGKPKFLQVGVPKGLDFLVASYKRGSNGLIVGQDDCYNEREQISAFVAQITLNQHTSALYVVVSASSDLAQWEKALSSESLIRKYPYWGTKKDRQNLLQMLSNEYFSTHSLFAHVLLASYETFMEDISIVASLQCQLSVIDVHRQTNDKITAIWPQLLSIRCRQRLLLCHSSHNFDARKLLHFLVPEVFSSRRKLLVNLTMFVHQLLRQLFLTQFVHSCGQAWNSAAFHPHHISAICNVVKAFVLSSNEGICAAFISNVASCTQQKSEIEMTAMDTLYKQGIVRAMEPSIMVPMKRVLSRKSRSRPSRHIPAQGKLEQPDPPTNHVDSQLVIKAHSVSSKKRRRSDGTPGSRQRIGRCGKCSGCLTEDCMKCGHCQDMKKYGGPGLRKQSCKNRKCLNPKIWGYATRKRKRSKTKRAKPSSSRINGDLEVDDDGSVAYSSIESDGESVSTAPHGNGDSGDESFRYSDAPIDSPRDLLLPASDTLLDDNLSLSDLSSRSASAKSRVVRCGECDGCNAPDCMKCPHCLDMKKYGGPGLRKQTCKNRKCNAPKILMLNKAKGGDDQYVDEKGNVVYSGRNDSVLGSSQRSHSSETASFSTPVHTEVLTVIQECERFVQPRLVFACVDCPARFSSNRILSFHVRVEHATLTSHESYSTAAWEREASRLLAQPIYQQAIMSAELKHQDGVSHTLPLGYAKLEGHGFQFFFVEPFIILGRMETRWCKLYKVLGYENLRGLPGGDVNCHIGNDSAIAARHAVISWDARSSRFAIECLSVQTPIFVNGQEIAFSSAPTLLSSRSIIQIGASVFYFLLPIATKASLQCTETVQFAAPEYHFCFRTLQKTEDDDNCIDDSLTRIAILANTDANIQGLVDKGDDVAGNTAAKASATNTSAKVAAPDSDKVDI
ncbi:putative forkhead-associated (FHA) domain, Zinc finger, CXXC-type, SMAD/FHA domain superfamily [Plasmopara halstedii]